MQSCQRPPNVPARFSLPEAVQSDHGNVLQIDVYMLISPAEHCVSYIMDATFSAYRFPADKRGVVFVHLYLSISPNLPQRMSEGVPPE